MKAIITVGLGFGDCAKGSCVDYLSRLHNADLVVRYNGGHQCGHNVVLPNGTHHCFHQYGSGTFAGVKTYLGRNMIISPEALLDETVQLQKKGIDNPASMLTINFDALVTTPWHALMNQMTEIERNDKAHGSCGVGVGETRKYWINRGCDAIYVYDLVGIGGYTRPFTLLDKLELMRQRYIAEAQKVVSSRTANKLQAMYEISPQAWVHKIRSIMQAFTFSNALPKFGTAIFEGAQGILLDENYGFHPHTTWSTTTSRHAFDELNDTGNVDVTVLGITRTYQTRHGNGPLPTWTPKRKIKGEHNKENDWQNNFRVGKFDVPLTKYAIKADGNIDGLFVTCVDHVVPGGMSYCPDYNPTPGNIVHPVPVISHNQKLGQFLCGVVNPKSEFGGMYEVIRDHIGLPVEYTSHGNTYKDKRQYG